VERADGRTRRAAGRRRAAAAAEGKAVRIRRRQLLLSDGPFAETKEQVGGFCLIECRDMDEAVEVAAQHPAAGYGTIEVRELWPPQ
jgi:Uncharacterized protein conserved in bacteria